MAEPLKNSFGPEIPVKIATMLKGPYPQFNSADFIKDVIEDYEPLDLLVRGWKIARILRRFLPEKTSQALQILIDSLGPILHTTESFGMAPFLYLPHVFFVSEYGLDDFELSMKAQYELTQRFSAEFSIRCFLEKYPEKTLLRLKEWTQDPSPHVRRLVSEGTRPRLPWASRLRAFQKDPQPVLALLEILKDDPDLYVRRSVANNLNDIGKDHPSLLVAVANQWWDGASSERQWLIKHALRSAIKRGEPGALKVLGFGKESTLSIKNKKIIPESPSIGDSIQVSLDLFNPSSEEQTVHVDLAIHFMKSNGKPTPKIFKMKSMSVPSQQQRSLQKTISLRPMTTRQHYPGEHRVEVVLNGKKHELGSFELKA